MPRSSPSWLAFCENYPPYLVIKEPKTEKEREELEAELYRQIGQLKVELEWLKKNLFSSVEEKRKMIEPLNPEIPVYRQCELIGLLPLPITMRQEKRVSIICSL